MDFAGTTGAWGPVCPSSETAHANHPQEALGDGDQANRVPDAGSRRDPAHARIPPADRQAVVEILVDTKKDLAPYLR